MKKIRFKIVIVNGSMQVFQAVTELHNPLYICIFCGTQIKRAVG